MRRVATLLAAWAAAMALGVSGAPAAGPPGAAAPGRGVRDVVGVTHVAGTYCRTDKDFLAEGADEVLALGSRVIKLYLHKPRTNYPFHTEWPEAASLADLARLPPYAAVFAKPFTTYILTAYALGRPDHYWKDGLSDAQKADEARQFHDLARHLLEAYRGTGKTFVLQHWEGDWAVRGHFDAKADPSAEAMARMAEWLNARQDGVDRARAEAGPRGVQVYHAAEVNLVVPSMRDGRPGVVNRVLPHTRVDLVSYSAWDGQGDAATLREALDFIARCAPDRPPFGDRNVYVGEFGLPENEAGPAKVLETVRRVVETGRAWGCPWIVYWQLYCNEARQRPVRRNEDVRGFWLIRPDGTRSPVWDYLHGLFGPAAG